MRSSVLSRGTIAIAAAVLFSAGCSDSSSGPNQKPPAEVEVVFGADQSGMAGAQLPDPIVVLVLDAAGNPVPNTPMTFQVMAGGGTIQGATARTDGDGLAGTLWTLGTAMHVEQRLEARATSSSGATLASVSILASVGPGAPARLEIVAPTPGGNVYPGARVSDQYGNPIPGVTITFAVIAGGGSLEGATQTSNVLGVATVGRWNLGAPGANTIQASSGTLTPVTYTIMQRDNTPTRVILAAGQGQTAVVGTPVPVAPSVIVQNAAGDALPDVVVTFTPGPGSGNVSFPTATTGANGRATLGGWSLGNATGPQTLVASASATATFTFNATATPARVGRLEKHAGDGQIATVGTTLPTAPAVKVLDVYGNAVPGVAVTFSVYNGLGSITGPNAVSDAAGIATVGSWTLGPFGGTQTLRATTPDGSHVDITAQATSNQAALIRAHPDNPTAALVRTEITLSVIVVDDIDRPKAGVAVSFAPLSSQLYGGGSVIAPSQDVMTNAQGVASVRYVMPDNTLAPGGVDASSPGVPTLRMNVSPRTGPPSEILVSLPSTPVAAGGDLGRPVFSVVDQFGNSIIFHPVTFTVTAGGGLLDGAVERTVSTSAPPGTTTNGPMWKSGPVAGVNTIVLSAENLPSVTVTRTTVSPP